MALNYLGIGSRLKLLTTKKIRGAGALWGDCVLFELKVFGFGLSTRQLGPTVSLLNFDSGERPRRKVREVVVE